MGDFYVVATPIGNLGDITKRALEVFKSVDYVVAEDTRVTGQLLRCFEINKKLISCHKFSEHQKADEILSLLEQGFSLAYATDAGTPSISDPGAVLVGFLANNGVDIIPVPGASAVTAALSVCGFNENEFSFLGFLGRNKGDITRRLEAEKTSAVPLFVIYESPIRVIDTLRIVAQVFPDAQAVVCNDMTKKFERVYRGDIDNVIAELDANEKSGKGEYVAVIRKNSKPNPDREQQSIESMLTDIMAKEGQTLTAAVKLLNAREKELKKRDIYDASLRLKELFE
ncbi:MAG: 16S rRNA (cytidine(1402)-2'-O)-methyltransferase [Clostridia bacterium]|nr:16S rRNA (cytidine(1402)-2'-O)-methyltransferase [Clostridia bacterium]